jgi:hypothetical protein
MKSIRHIAVVPRAGAIALLALICSCSRESRLEGRYSSTDGLVEMEFKDAHKANLSTKMGGGTLEFDYERTGKEVKMKFPDETVIATIGDDGCLNLGAIPKPLCKEKVASSNFLKRAISREPRLEGRYASSPEGMFELEFKDNNKVNQITLFGTTEIDYEVSGKEVKLKAPTGTMVGTIGDDGCLNFGGFYGSMCKRKIASSGSSNAGPDVPAVATAPLGARGSSPASTEMPAGYLQEMPTADRVLADFSGPDSVETRVRRYKAAVFLREALYVIANNQNFTPEESRLHQGYTFAESQLRSGSAGVPGLTAKMDSLCCGKPAEVAIHRQILEHYFTPAWQTAFLARENAIREREEARR